MVMTAESMHEITGSNPAVMHLFSYCFENSIYAYVLLYTHLESYTPGQDQAKSYVPVCTGMYRYIQVYASTGFLVKYVLVCTGMYQKHDMKVSHTCRQLFESKQ